MQNQLKTAEKSPNISTGHMAQWVVDKMVSGNSVHIQSLLYSKNLMPDQLESVYVIQLGELSTYSKIRNIAELYDRDDDISSLKYASYNPEHFISSVTKHALRLTGGHNIEVYSSCDTQTKSAVFDLRRTSLILYNLISNAIMHTKLKNKVIEIHAFTKGDDFIISVKDNGRRISAEKRKNLFFAYENTPVLKSADMADAGLFISGLGLSVCLKTAKDMGGNIVYIPPRDYGNEFQLIIPQTAHSNIVGEPILAEPDLDELKTCLAGAMLSLIRDNK